MKSIKTMVLLTTLILVFTACSKNTTNSRAETLLNVENTTIVSMEQNVQDITMNTGKQAPGFDLMDVSGNTHKLSEYADKKVYIKFWASWCSICLAGLEELNTLAGEDEDFIILTVVSPGYKNEKKSDAFIKWFNGVENVSNIKVLLDEEGTLAKEIGLRGYPTSAFIGSDGVLIKTRPGHVSSAEIKIEFENIN